MTSDQHWHWLVKGFSGLVNALHRTQHDPHAQAMPEHVQRELEAWIGTLNAVLHEQRHRLIRQRMEELASRRKFAGLDWSGLIDEATLANVEPLYSDGKQIGHREEWQVTGKAGG